jgi:hypothetical protein
MNEEAVPAFAASFVWKPIAIILACALNDATRGAALINTCR